MSETEDRPTGELIAEHLLGTTEEASGAVKSGRRSIDWRAAFTLRGEVSIFFFLFGCFLDERKKPSMTRIMLAIWTYLGCLMVRHELALIAGQPSLQNVAWDAWWKVEGLLIFGMIGPSVASYFGPGAAGAISLAGAARDMAGKLGVKLPAEGKSL